MINLILALALLAAAVGASGAVVETLGEAAPQAIACGSGGGGNC